MSVSRFQAIVGLLVASCLGCGGGDTPPLGLVTGTVTLDGKPVEGAMVQFEPSASAMPTAFGTTDATGKYELWYSRGNKGASLGESVVRISAFQEAGDDPGQAKRPEIIPVTYNLNSDLKVEVKRGKQVCDFPLKSGGQIVQPDAPEGAARRSAVTGCN